MSIKEPGKRIEDIIIYESPDGGKTVYVRRYNPNTKPTALRVLVYKEPEEINLNSADFIEIKRLAAGNHTLKEHLKKLETLYLLIKDGD